MKSQRFNTRSFFLILAVGLSPLSVLAQFPAVRARVMQPVDMHNLVELRGNVHPLARPEFDQGPAPDDLPMERMLLVLQRGADQEAALRQLLDDQQVKSSPRFHQWLTPEQFGQQFGPADSDLQAVTDWLTSQGLQVSKVSAGRTVIEFSGTAGLVRQAGSNGVRTCAWREYYRQGSRKFTEVLALMPSESSAVMDVDFARDIEGAITRHREPLEGPKWD